MCVIITFCNCVSLSEVKLSNSVTQILDYAFSGCKSLKAITLPKSITYVAENAFDQYTKIFYE